MYSCSSWFWHHLVCRLFHCNFLRLHSLGIRYISYHRSLYYPGTYRIIVTTISHHMSSNYLSRYRSIGMIILTGFHLYWHVIERLRLIPGVLLQISSIS